MNAIELSEQLLLTVKMHSDSSELLERIGSLDDNKLNATLISQEDRLAFWLNLYNGFFQVKVLANPALFGNKVKMFFGRHFQVAGMNMSLDEIEHDMLRKSMYKWSLGYIRKPFPSSFKRAFRVFERDPRVHFAMNCGAKSCPPIRFYSPEQINEQLDLSTISFLHREVQYDERSNIVIATPLFNWFRGDFGGMKGIKEFLFRYEVIPSTDVKVKFSKYNWEEAFENYA